MKAMGVDGSTTSHGGIVKATQSTTKTDGKPWLRESDGFACPKCKTWSTLIRNNTTVSVHGKKAAVVGDKFTCGATLEQAQSYTWVGSGSEAVAASSISGLQSTTSSQNTNSNLVGDKDKYEIYYIERNKTDYVTFKNFIFPYDEDKKSLFGVVTQAISGVCTFIVTYIVKGLDLFVTVSFIPPSLSADATIHPSATLKIYREENRQFEFISSETLKIGNGIWNTEKGVEPVGSCNIKLPKPNLSTLKVTLDLGYEAKHDGGTAVPNPRFTTHTFTLSSGSRLAK
ncbi:PAAR domain-containing protein [Acinetobacter gerneri]|jgi:uncharacterized Zn-binding protein involved in type VI secretion|uniref:PAAR domain-containing protein n=1 Tax=Acinetobacter gerneri TaxID=202952 RepID=UPI0023EFDA98|nr:PAAR domain-containing protein [Acinetobacter gerneri]MCH4245171.1 PAAR domain-containing protein [Acinetobacter gerneri]